MIRNSYSITLLMLLIPTARLLALLKPMWPFLIFSALKLWLPKIIQSTQIESLRYLKLMQKHRVLINLPPLIKLLMAPCLSMFLLILRSNSYISTIISAMSSSLALLPTNWTSSIISLFITGLYAVPPWYCCRKEILLLWWR